MPRGKGIIPVELRLMEKIELSDDGCWLFTGALSKDGYGRISHNGSWRSAARVAYKVWREDIPDHMTIDHLCRVRRCINPDHLEPVPQAVNKRRGEGGRNMRDKTHCPQGHPYDEANTYRTPLGYRMCRACNRAAQRRYQMRKKGRE